MGPKILMAPDVKCKSHRIKTTDGAELQVYSAGPQIAEHTLLLFHSGVGHSGMFAHQLRSLPSADLQVVSFDRRGQGGTRPRPATAEESSQRADVGDDVTAVLAALDIDRPVHLVGVAAGGRAAAEVALAAPHSAASLTLVASLAGLTADLYPAGVEFLLPEAFLALPDYLKELGHNYRGADPDGTRIWLDLLAQGRAVQDSYRETSPSQLKQPPLGPPRASLLSVAALSDLVAGKEGIPLQLIAGDSDPYVTAAAYHGLAEKIPGATVDVISGAGHSPYWEQPEDFNRVLLKRLFQR